MIIYVFMCWLLEISTACSRTPELEIPSTTTPIPTCSQIEGDAIITPAGTRNIKETVSISCSTNRRVQVDNRLLDSGVTTTLICVSPGWEENGVAVTTVTCVPECPQITSGADVIIDPPGTQLDQTTIMVSCPNGKRLRVGDISQPTGATGTLTCSADGWMDGTTVVTMVSCDTECAQLNTGPDVIITPMGPQIDTEMVMVSCPAGSRLRLNTQSQASGASATLFCFMSQWWLDQNTPIAIATCDLECPEVMKDANVILNPPGAQLGNTMVMASCPMNKRLKLNNQLLPVNTPGTITCTAPNWMNGATVITMVTCEEPCPANYMFNLDFNACYLVGMMTLTQSQAKDACAQTGGALVSIKTQAENTYIVSITRNNPPIPGNPLFQSTVWIGVERNPANINQFIYTDDNMPIATWAEGADPDQWATLQPSNTAEVCVQLISEHVIFAGRTEDEFMKWHDIDCTLTAPRYVCKIAL